MNSCTLLGVPVCVARCTGKPTIQRDARSQLLPHCTKLLLLKSKVATLVSSGIWIWAMELLSHPNSWLDVWSCLHWMLEETLQEANGFATDPSGFADCLLWGVRLSNLA